MCAGGIAIATHPPCPLAKRRQSLIVLRQADITVFSISAWLFPPTEKLILPVESEIAMAIHGSSACASGVAANAMPIAIAATAGFFMALPALVRCVAPK
ncbi:hypothetical protein A9X00_26355 [Mycobacterium sp. 1245805.9]|nr:hypothetical protein A9X00_26355 [Mycobacterium sp. 1245805.9]